MTNFEEGQINIHTENIFPIIKKAVYSDHEIFLRELVSNSVDAINKRRMASIAGDCQSGEEGKINITINRELNTLTISDNGIGMTADEVKKYINQVAFSSAEEFLEKYKSSEEGIIGHFGLGFYSSFMVAKNVELITKSAKKDSISYKWKCDGSPNFTLEEFDKETIGTDVILHLLEEELEYIEPSRIRSLITKYCDFMPVEVCLEEETINKRNPPWRKSVRELTDNDYIELYKYLYPYQGDPLLWIHLNTDYPFSLQGILFFPRITGRADWEQGEIKLYSNQVFVSDTVKEVVPRFLLPLRGVIDSTDIPLNVSRSALQTDRRVRSIGNFVAKKVADRLKELKRDSPSKYAEVWDSIAPFVKIGAMEDEKFADQVQDIILFSTSIALESDKVEDGIIKANDKIYTTITNYNSRIANGSAPTVLYCTDKVSQASALNLWTSQNKEVLFADTVIDTQFISWLEEKNKELKFIRVDSELSDEVTDNPSLVQDQNGDTKSEGLRELIKRSIENDKVTVQVQSLKGENSPPSMILLPEQMRRMNDFGALVEQRLPGLPDHHVLLINQKHPMVDEILKLNAGTVIVGTSSSASESLAKELAIHLYQLAKLGVGGLEPNEVQVFQERNAKLIADLLKARN